MTGWRAAFAQLWHRGYQTPTTWMPQPCFLSDMTRGIHALRAPVGGALGPPPGGLMGARTANLASGKLDADGKGAFRDGVVTGSRGRPSAARAGAAAGARPAPHRR